MGFESGISVIMPAFNAEKTIECAIVSVINQEYNPLEIIVIDDCSSDATAEIVKRFEKEDSRIRLICNESNKGVAYSRNAGVKEAKYDLIAFLDSDDCWAEGKLQEQTKLLFKHPDSAICFTGTSYINEDERKAGYTLEAPSRVTYNDILKQNVMSCSSVLAKKEMLLKHPMPDDRNVHEDLAVWLGILKETPYAVGLNEPMLIYRLSSDGKSGNKLKAAMMQIKTYKICNVPPLKGLYYFGVYALKNIKKYHLLKMKS